MAKPSILQCFLHSSCFALVALGTLFLSEQGSAVWGGEKASKDEYRSVVSIRGDMDCSAVVISPRALLTAGHCVERWSSGKSLIDISLQSVKSPTDSVTFTLEKAPILHPAYRLGFRKNPNQDSQEIQNDLAVLLLKEDLKAKLPNVSVAMISTYLSSQNGVLVGFGRYDRRNQYGVKAFGEMRTRYLSVFNLIELRSVKDRVGGCRGDSGGGFFQTLSDQSTVLVGITSVNTQKNNCGSSENKTYVVPVHSHICWVTSVARLNQPQFCLNKKGETL